MNRKPTFFWQGLLIVLPVLLLAAVGIVSLWKDRETVTLEARKTAGQYGGQLAAFLSTGLELSSENLASLIMPATGPEGISTERVSYWPDPPFPRLWVHGSKVDSNGNLIRVGPNAPGVYPKVPSVRPFPLEQLDAEAMELWKVARSAELTGDPAGSMEAYERFLATEPPEPFHSNAEYARSVLLAVSAENEEAFAVLQSLDQTAEFTETGLPLAVLAQFQRVKLLALELSGGNNHAEVRMKGAISDLCAKSLEQASFATPSLLNAMADLVEEFGDDFLDPIRLAQMTWAADEYTRAFYQSVKPLVLRNLGATNWFWTEWNVDFRLVVLSLVGSAAATSASEMDWFEMQVYSESLLQRAIATLLARAPMRPPEYLAPSVYLSGRRVSGMDPDGEVLATAEHDWGIGGTSVGGLSIVLHLVDPDLLYAQQRQRMLWFGALIVLAAAAALTGYAVARHAFHRQLFLNEMKSNFVASVSHELRAPIASVRLMAEGLDRGTVQDPEKQRGYFKFIVQECSRLSSLVENVLDFSRIEQDRREYEFEPTDLVVLVRHTAELMHPCAVERQVRLTTNIDPQLSRLAAKPELDGKSIQQALVNLIDNAIKHSHAQAAVAVELSLGNEGGSILLSVQDSGEGIPAAEHKRIFERFYRLGSELRRKTQGAGIGLSIVKHIVEGHGGTIRVQSKVGEGSRFIIEIPTTVGEHG